MKRWHLRTIIVWGTLVLTCLIIVQVYWFTRAFDVAEKQFDHRVQMALRKVADSVSNDPEIKKLSSNFFYVDTHSDLKNTALDSLLKREFELHDLTMVYELGIYKAEDDTLVYGNYIKATMHRSSSESTIVLTP
jgi:two-component system phosphate regulon sensor histidine kinase PhoR